MEVGITAQPSLPWQPTDVTHRMETIPTGPGFGWEVLGLESSAKLT